jgi:hypothetical protein
MSDPDRRDEDDYRPRNFLEILYGNRRRWMWIGALIAILLVLKATGHLD